MSLSKNREFIQFQLGDKKKTLRREFEKNREFIQFQFQLGEKLWHLDEFSFKK